MKINFKIGLTTIVFGLSACTTTPYVWHSKVEISSCKNPFTAAEMQREIIQKGFYKDALTHGAYSVYHKPNFFKKNILSQEAFEDRAGDVAVASCFPNMQNSSQGIILIEEFRSCPKTKNCTKENQEELVQWIKSHGCEVNVASYRSKKWMVEERQDWDPRTCQEISKNLD
jgi:hypothetical protein